MRIVAGRWKGLHISFPVFVRPTQDKVRQAIFNVLRDVVKGNRVLDLFAGSGAMGFEALSQGAAQAYFIDSDPRCISIIRENLGFLEKEGGLDFPAAHIYRNDAFRAVQILAKRNIVFEVIFIDPPYHKGLAKKALKSIALGGILTPLGFAVVEHAKTDVLDGVQEGYIPVKTLTYGDICVSVFQKRSGVKIR